MENNETINQPQIELSQTSMVKSPNGDIIFNQGMILRKVSKFLSGTSEDGIIPIPVIYEIKTGLIVKSTIPEELRDEYEPYTLKDQEIE